MKFQSEITVYGMKPSKGQLDNGQTFDSTKVFTLVDLDTRKGEGSGQAGHEYPFNDSTEYDKFKLLPYPFKATADFEIVTSGKQQRTIIVGLRPVANQPVSPAKQ